MDLKLTTILAYADISTIGTSLAVDDTVSDFGLLWRRWVVEKAYEFMKQFVIGGRNMLDVFRERIDEVKEWVHRKVAGMGCPKW